jgi:isocitrate dehydrogenase kinase/phosphatase
MNQPTTNLDQFVTRRELYEFGQALAQEITQTILSGFEAYMENFRAELNQRFEAMDQKFDMRFDYQEKRLDHLVDDVADIKKFLKPQGFRDQHEKLKA